MARIDGNRDGTELKLCLHKDEETPELVKELEKTGWTLYADGKFLDFLAPTSLDILNKTYYGENLKEGEQIILPRAVDSPWVQEIYRRLVQKQKEAQNDNK